MDFLKLFIYRCRSLDPAWTGENEVIGNKTPKSDMGWVKTDMFSFQYNSKIQLYADLKKTRVCFSVNLGDKKPGPCDKGHQGWRKSSLVIINPGTKRSIFGHWWIVWIQPAYFDLGFRWCCWKHFDNLILWFITYKPKNNFNSCEKTPFIMIWHQWSPMLTEPYSTDTVALALTFILTGSIMNIKYQMNMIWKILYTHIKCAI